MRLTDEEYKRTMSLLENSAIILSAVKEQLDTLRASKRHDFASMGFVSFAAYNLQSTLTAVKDAMDCLAKYNAPDSESE